MKYCHYICTTFFEKLPRGFPLWGNVKGASLWGIASAGNWLFGGVDNWINKGMSFKQSFSTANNPIVFSGNYHPGSNSLSNTQASAQQLVGSMANAEQGVHINIAGFSGMGRYSEGQLFTSTPFDQFVGESPLAYGVANSNIGVFSPVSLKENVYVNVLTGFKYLWHYQQGTLPSHETERWQSKKLKMSDIFDFSTAENWKKGGFMGGSDVIFGNIQGVEIMLQNTTFNGNLQLDPVRNNMLSIYQSEPYVGLRRVAYIRFYQEHHNYYINARRFIYSKW